MNAYKSRIPTVLTKTSINVGLPLLLIVVGILGMYLPTFIDLFKGIWSTDQQAHGPIVLAVAIWFFYFKTKLLINLDIPVIPAPIRGWFTLIIGSLLYAIGRSQSLYIFEVGSLVVVLLGIMLIFFGAKVARHYWFAFFFMFFMVPLPGSVVDAMTQPMKIAVSYASEHILYWLDYPVARSGVIITIGQYQLLVADACAGLNSLFTLEALGLLYMNVMRHESAFRNALLATLIVPISFASNVTRVMVLSLITYYWGDAAGQGFLHEFSGMVLFITALLLIMGLTHCSGRSHLHGANLMLSNAIRVVKLPLKTSIAVCILLISSAVVSVFATPSYKTLTQPPELEKAIPLQLGTWVNKPSPYAQVSVNAGTQQLLDVVYEQVLMRTYEDTSGNELMLAVAFAGEQRQEIKIHQPEVCYPAQGYQTVALSPHIFNIAGYPFPITGKQLIFKKDNRVEAVSYWIRLGNSFPTTGMQMRLKILKDGLKGNLDDGVLVRVSSIITQESDAPIAYKLHENFLTDLVTIVGKSTPNLIVPAEL